MNSIHDMGGMDGFGHVEPEANEPVFHAPWEGRVLAMQRAMRVGYWTIDESRAAQEVLPPQVYLGASYYQRWLMGLEHGILANGLATEDELAAGRMLQKGPPPKRVLTAAEIPAHLAKGTSYERPAPGPAKFKPGDKVRTQNNHPTTHTRLPRYARGRLGVVEAVRGCHVFPDSVTTGHGEDPHWLYTVVFSGPELWGERAEPSLKVSIDAWEPYLIPA
jgi:nitrile hydratase subunit beta